MSFDRFEDVGILRYERIDDGGTDIVHWEGDVKTLSSLLEDAQVVDEKLTRIGLKNCLTGMVTDTNYEPVRGDRYLDVPTNFVNEVRTQLLD